MGRTLRFTRGLRAYVLRSESLHHRHARACRTKRKSMIATRVQSIEETPRKAVGSRNAGRAPMPDHVGPSTQPGEIECEVPIGVGGIKVYRSRGRGTARALTRRFFSGHRDFRAAARARVSISRINSTVALSSNQREKAFISTRGWSKVWSPYPWTGGGQQRFRREIRGNIFSVRCVRIHSKNRREVRGGGGRRWLGQ
jgi:hypothetical protein